MQRFSDKISIPYRTSLPDSRDLNLYMFQEDLASNIVPVYGYSDGTYAKCTIEPANSLIEDVLKDALPTIQPVYGRRDPFSESILGSIQFIVRHLVQYGSLILELIKYEDEFTGELNYKLEPIYGLEVSVKGNEVIQLLNPKLPGKIYSEESVSIPLDKCLTFNFPDSLGGTYDYLRFIDEFEKLSEQDPMKDVFANPLEGYQGYNIKEHRRLHRIYLWRKSNGYSWHHRARGGEDISSYYYIYRRLHFQITRIMLRDSAIDQLKETFSNLSEFLGEKVELKIEGLITIEDVQDGLSKWKLGNINPRDISKIL